MATEELTPLDGAAAPTGSPMDGLAWAETLGLTAVQGAARLGEVPEPTFETRPFLESLW
jgi:hypothetical protein